MIFGILGLMFVFKQKTAYEMRISDWSSDVCSSDLFATHIGYYQMINGMERLPKNPPEGYKLYPGGHFISYDLATGELDDLALTPDGEGIQIGRASCRERVCQYV